MSKPVYRIFSDADELAGALAVSFSEDLNGLLQKQDRITLALSGGSTPLRFYRSLVRIPLVRSIDWSRVLFFWSDERCVPPQHPESNFGLASREFFKPLGIPEESIFRVRGEDDPVREAGRYGRIISEMLPHSDGTPRFDRVFLGMGEDGHTASVFPHEIRLWTSDEMCEVAHHPVTGQQRITFTGRLINRARVVSLLVSGESKRRVVNEVAGRSEAYGSYPVSLVAPGEGLLEWWLDSDAAGDLTASIG